MITNSTGNNEAKNTAANTTDNMTDNDTLNGRNPSAALATEPTKKPFTIITQCHPGMGYEMDGGTGHTERHGDGYLAFVLNEHGEKFGGRR